MAQGGLKKGGSSKAKSAGTKKKSQKGPRAQTSGSAAAKKMAGSYVRMLESELAGKAKSRRENLSVIKAPVTEEKPKDNAKGKAKGKAKAKK